MIFILLRQKLFVEFFFYIFNKSDSFTVNYFVYTYTRGVEMKYMFQFMIIAVISCVGELLNYLLPLPVPASVYGVIILFICLLSGIIKLEQINEAAGFLLNIMPLLFVPAAVNLITVYSDIKGSIIQIIIITLISTVVVMSVTGVVSQVIIKKRKARK